VHSAQPITRLAFLLALASISITAVTAAPSGQALEGPIVAWARTKGKAGVSEAVNLLQATRNATGMSVLESIARTILNSKQEQTRTGQSEPRELARSVLELIRKEGKPEVMTALSQIQRVGQLNEMVAVVVAGPGTTALSGGVETPPAEITISEVTLDGFGGAGGGALVGSLVKGIVQGATFVGRSIKGIAGKAFARP
jgi:hypothetical protein